MRLAPKIFLASALVILVLVLVAGWSLLAVSRLAEANREIVARSLPALRLATGLRESMTALVRLEGRAVVLRDDRFAALWDERAEQAASDFEQLPAVLTTPEELARHAEAAGAFMEYRRLVASARQLSERGAREGAIRLSEGPARQAAERADTGLEQLRVATYAALDRSQAGARALEARTWKAVVAALVASVVGALAATAVLAVRMTRSLRGLTRATSQLAEGAFTEPLPNRDRDEIGDLARSFNRMAERLREVDTLKQEFFSQMSHEFRTPLTSIREATQLLLERVPGPLEPKQARLLDIVSASTERLLRMVNEILELSRLRARLLPLERQWVDLDKLVDRAMDELRPQAEEKGLRVARSSEGGDRSLFGDEDRLLRVVVNLLDNAVKYTASGTITVRLHGHEDEVQLVVEDEGEGIPSDALPRVFEPYQQARRGRAGSGLGLAIVKSLVEAHDGSVRVDSEEGAGSRFTVTLPRARGAP